MGDGGTVFKRELELAQIQLLREELGREPTEQELDGLRAQLDGLRASQEELTPAWEQELADSLAEALKGDPLALSVHDTL